jgi:hypothetical protein
LADRIPEPIYAKEFLERKLNVKTDAWDDLKHGEHSHAFTVAHSIEANILDDIHGLLNKAMANGESFNTFKKGLFEAMEKHGWYGGAGHTKEDKKYLNWRARVIYDTNFKTSLAAGRERQQKEHADMRPIWVYQSKLVGKNRRQEHIALHDKAFRYDDPFWDTYYPPNEWGCECSVTTKSVSGAERDGIELLKSGSDGNPPPMRDREGNPVDWGKFAGKTWNYNPGAEMLAPSFGKYKNLSEIRMDDGLTALRHVINRYVKDMSETRMSQGQFSHLISRMEKGEYKTKGILYQVGNLTGDQFEAMLKAGIGDSKIMASDTRIYHGTISKNNDQRIPASMYTALYETFQNPNEIYEEVKALHPNQGKVFHFVRDTKDGKKIKVLLLQRTPGLALRVQTMGWATYVYTGANYKKIW